MRKYLPMILLAVFISTALANHLSFFLGFALSGAAFPYIGIHYDVGNFKFGGSLGFIMGPDGKNPNQWYYMFSPNVELMYLLTKSFSVVWNARAIIVLPHQSEQLYLLGIGGGYSTPIWNGNLNLKFSADFILPISAGEKAWSRGKMFPIPFIEGEYEISGLSLGTP